MKKLSKIGLLLFVMSVLLMTLAVPTYAESEPPEESKLLFPSYNNSGTFNLNLRLLGDSYIGWENEILVNVCEGNVPFGVSISPGLTWIEYNDLSSLVKSYRVKMLNVS